ncbi:MAG: hypothetical protein CMG25_03945 [Candidatus Marinimicrobia bacterium]|nr:hypothetical protein [Candidatus Neomarinimicrobiota bacterium]|tara:strand:+ start:27573 stop:28175 length:603 start_codon:yes stop_codon:yes gene_type:complete
MNLILISIIILFIFAYIGFSYQFNMGKHLMDFNRLKKFESNIIDIINNNLEFEDSLMIQEIHSIVKNQVSTLSFLAPIDGFVTQSINNISNHHGIDIAATKGEKILASQNGMVIFSGFNGDLGNTIIISHSYNYFTVYSHCDLLLVDERAIVKIGDVIGTIGESGKATAPHLHFEIWHNDSIIDPRNMINKYGEFDVSTE